MKENAEESCLTAKKTPLDFRNEQSRQNRQTAPKARPAIMCLQRTSWIVAASSSTSSPPLLPRHTHEHMPTIANSQSVPINHVRRDYGLAVELP